VKYERLTTLSIRSHPELSERWVQERIAEDPSILGLGDVILKDKERIQTAAGRLDLLLQEADSSRRYEVEVQLGRTDESHIIRTIEYWDIERKRYPQYDHTAVLIAEDITSRFLNVIGLFNGTIPLMAIQMRAVQLGDSVSLAFTTVLDQVRLGLVDEDEETHEETNRTYWENRGSKATVAMADELLEIVKTLNPHLELKYNKFYIGLAKDGQPNNFVTFRPRKSALRVEPRLQKTEEIETAVEAAGLDVMDYDNRWGRYRIRLQKGDVTKHADVLRRLLEMSYKESGGGDA
jgi:predicted transport protein